MVTTLYLMMKDVLPLPWNQGMDHIPASSIFFTSIDMIKCALMVNIFNVYIGQVDCLKTFKYYINLATGHTPFFVHSICLRVLAFAFFAVYLNAYCLVPVFLIWLSNLLIGNSEIQNILI